MNIAPQREIPSSKTLATRVVDRLGNLLLRPPIGGLWQVYTNGPRTERRVALTFDDGPTAPSTSEVLDVLAAQGVKATFFCVGWNSCLLPELVQRAFHEGHVIGNHSMYHGRTPGIQWREDAHIDESAGVLTDLLGLTPRLYRAPWGWLTPWEVHRLVSRNLSIIGWDVDTYDWRTPSPDGEAMATTAQERCRPGSIILFHDGVAGMDWVAKPDTARGVEDTIASLRRDGYEFVTIPELLNVEAYQEKQSGVLPGGTAD